MKPKFQLSRLLPKNLGYMAMELETFLREAPGRSLPPPVRKPRSNSKLELADAEIRRCTDCGSWHIQDVGTLCAWCSKNPYPTIDDI